MQAVLNKQQILPEKNVNMCFQQTNKQNQLLNIFQLPQKYMTAACRRKIELQPGFQSISDWRMPDDECVPA